jgi:hypothetical protein
MPEATDLHHFCPSCGTEATAGQSYCSGCGQSLQRTPTESADASSRSSSKMTALRWVNVIALGGCAVGLLLTWASVALSSVTGINTSDGKFFGAVLIVTALLGIWYVISSNRIAAVLLLIGWIGLLSLAVYEIVNVSSVKVPLFGSVNVGAGLYVDAIAAAVGTVTAAIDMSITWTRPDASRATWVVWTTCVVAVLAAVGAGIGGHNAQNTAFSNSNRTPPGNFGTGSTGSTGSTGTSGSTGTTGSTGTGTTGSTGTSGTSGSTGSTP